MIGLVGGVCGWNDWGVGSAEEDVEPRRDVLADCLLDLGLQYAHLNASVVAHCFTRDLVLRLQAKARAPADTYQLVPVKQAVGKQGRPDTCVCLALGALPPGPPWGCAGLARLGLIDIGRWLRGGGCRLAV